MEWLWQRLPDWRQRLDTFDALHGAGMTAEKVAFFLISSEVNDRCFDLADVEEVAQEVKSRYPEIPVAFIYGATHNRDDVLISEPPPAFFPAVFDVVGLFSYDNFDLADPLEPRNATGSYYNQEDPHNSSTIYGDLLGKLHPHQKVLLVFDADYSGGPDPCVDPAAGPPSGNAAQGWCRADLAEIADNRDERGATLFGTSVRSRLGSGGSNHLGQLGGRRSGLTGKEAEMKITTQVKAGEIMDIDNDWPT